MKSRLKDEFNREQRRALCRDLAQAMRSTKDARMFQRYQAIKLALEGLTNAEIGAIIGRTAETVRNYVDSFRNEGFQGLIIKHSSGRPRYLSAEQEQLVRTVIEHKTPEEVGFPAEMNWTSPLVQAWIEKEFGVVYADRSVRALLYRLDFSFTAPTYRLAKADPEKKTVFEQIQASQESAS